ncbi:MAG: ferritin family protein [Candidatus Brocadiaceae bacterium]|nr:ferritin family protein [Candidatus Brocadiaceae bacterium]
MKETLKDIREIALQMEIDGIKFYNDLAGRTLHPIGKAMFRSFVEDEKLHAKKLRILLSANEEAMQTEEESEVTVKERLVTIFQELGEELKERIGVGANDLEALKLAIEIEESGVRFYEQAAKDADNIKNRETYRFLVGEEKTHLDILKNSLEYLENKERWEVGNEGRIYEQWMSVVNKTMKDTE